MKMKFVLLAVLLMWPGAMSARADAFSERMDRVKEGMSQAAVVMFIGQPESVQNKEDRLVYYYTDRQTKARWSVTFVRGRVDSVDEL